MNHFILSCWSYFKTKNLALILVILGYVQKVTAHFFRQGVNRGTQKNAQEATAQRRQKKKRKIQGQQKSNSFLRCGLRLFLTWQNFKLSTRSTESKQETKRNCWTRARRSFKLQDLKELQKQLSVNGSKKRMPEIMKSWVCFLWYMDTSVK